MQFLQLSLYYQTLPGLSICYLTVPTSRKGFDLGDSIRQYISSDLFLPHDAYASAVQTIVVKFELGLFELIYWLELYDLYYKKIKFIVTNANKCK